MVAATTYDSEGMLAAGSVLLNKYRIDRVIGQGGMGMVALAEHLALHQPVAIKLLLPEVLDKHTVVQRFLREAQASVRLRSEHVCRVIDVGQLDNGAPYMVMEYLEGLDLEALLRQEGRLLPGDGVDFVLQACEALAEAHALGIIHRDLKPSNFFLTRRADGSALIKVLDFGISKTTSELDESLTTTQAILGTPAYMSPEQLRASKHVDARSDIWALGVVLFELLAGFRPFSATSFSELVLKVAMEPAPPLPPEVPADLAALVGRCLSKEPDARFRNVAELVSALAPFARTPSIAQSAVERTARIASGGIATYTPNGARASSHPRVVGFGTAETAPMRPPISGVEPTVSASASPSTMNVASGELVRPAPALAAPAVRKRSGAKLALLGALGAAAATATFLLVWRGADPDAGAAASPRLAPASSPVVPPLALPAPAAAAEPAPAQPSPDAPAQPASAAGPTAPTAPAVAQPSPVDPAASPPAGAAASADEPAKKSTRKRRKKRGESSGSAGPGDSEDEEILGSRQ